VLLRGSGFFFPIFIFIKVIIKIIIKIIIVFNLFIKIFVFLILFFLLLRLHCLFCSRLNCSLGGCSKRLLLRGGSFRLSRKLSRNTKRLSRGSFLCLL